MNTNTIQSGHWLAHLDRELTPREAEAVVHVACGETNKMAARSMGCAPQTIAKTLQRAMYKLNTWSRAETVAEAIRRGILTPYLVLVMAVFIGCGVGEDNVFRGRLRTRSGSQVVRLVRNARRETV